MSSLLSMMTVRKQVTRQEPCWSTGPSANTSASEPIPLCFLSYKYVSNLSAPIKGRSTPPVFLNTSFLQSYLVFCIFSLFLQDHSLQMTNTVQYLLTEVKKQTTLSSMSSSSFHSFSLLLYFLTSMSLFNPPLYGICSHFSKVQVNVTK